MKPQYATVIRTDAAGITTLEIMHTGQIIHRTLPVNVTPGQILLGIW